MDILMQDNKVPDSNEETIDLIKSCFGKLREKTNVVVTTKNTEIETLKAENAKIKQELELSESRRQTAEDMLAKIRDEVKSEMQNAYNTGYNAALNTNNPQGGPALSSNDDKKLVLTNQN